MPESDAEGPVLRQAAEGGPDHRLRGKRILFILPPRSFRDEEYEIPRTVFEASGASVTVASLSLTPAKGMLGGIVHPDVSVQDVRPGSFDALLLVGGTGCSVFWHNDAVHTLVKDFDRSGGTIGAICLAPVTLANAGVLQGKPATAYPSAGEFLAWKGATYPAKTVEKAGNIVTANGPDAAEEFARMLAQALE
jgi:protease I